MECIILHSNNRQEWSRPWIFVNLMMRNDISYGFVFFYYEWNGTAFHMFVLFLHCCLISKSCPTLYDPMDCSPPGSSVHGISQARVLKWVALPSPRALPDLGIKPMSPAQAGRFFLCSSLFPMFSLEFVGFVFLIFKCSYLCSRDISLSYMLQIFASNLSFYFAYVVFQFKIKYLKFFCIVNFSTFSLCVCMCVCVWTFFLL